MTRLSADIPCPVCGEPVTLTGPLTYTNGPDYDPSASAVRYVLAVELDSAPLAEHIVARHPDTGAVVPDWAAAGGISLGPFPVPPARPLDGGTLPDDTWPPAVRAEHDPRAIGDPHRDFDLCNRCGHFRVGHGRGPSGLCAYPATPTGDRCSCPGFVQAVTFGGPR